jgi:hypothetical protein
MVIPLYIWPGNPSRRHQKPRGTCNCSPWYEKIITIAETIAACIEQPVHHLTWTLIAALNYIRIGVDIGNAFTKAPAPKDPF